MKTKLIVISTAALLAVGIGFHLSGHCPLNHSGTANHTVVSTATVNR